MQGDLLKARDLKPLDDSGLLYLAARMAQRVAPWRPTGGAAAWDAALSVLVDVANGGIPQPAIVRKASRAIHGAAARDASSGEPESMWRSRSQAASTLGCGLAAALLAHRRERWKEVVQAGKHCASVFALQAHAGVMPIELALTVPWAAMRADVAAIADATVPLTVADLASLAPLWPGGEPLWARP